MSVMAGGTGVRFEKPGVYAIGPGDKTLAEAGPEIFTAVRVCTITLTSLLVGVLMFLALVVEIV